MHYVEMPIDEALKKCKKNARILVAIQDLKDDDADVVFVAKKGSDSDELFEYVKTVASMKDDFVSLLNLFTERQDIRNVKPYGIRKIIMLR